jgi:hypothetical protein
MGCESEQRWYNHRRLTIFRASHTEDRDGLRNIGKRLVGLLIAIVLTASIIVASWPQIATTHQMINNVPVGELVAGRRFGQTFRAPFSGLYRVDVVLATYRRRNKGPIIFHITDGIEGSEIATVEVEAAQIQDNAPKRFVFEPIANSVNREFYFYLEAPQAVSGNAITIWETDFDSYPSGQAYVDGQPTEGDLRFTAYYRSSPQEAWNTLTERVRTWHPLLWRARWLVLGAFLVFVLGIGVLLGELIAAGFG